MKPVRSHRRNGARGSAVVTALGVGAALLGASCFDATEIVLEIHSDACDSDLTKGGQVLVFVGPTLDQAASSPTSVAEVPSCGPHRQGDVVGTLALVPAESVEDDALVGIEVAEGIACVGPDGKRRPDACVLSRRGVRFQRHRTVRVPIFLRSVCRGKVCAASETCNERGDCVAASCGSDCSAVEPLPDGGRVPSPALDGSRPDVKLDAPLEVSVTPADGGQCGQPGVACGPDRCTNTTPICCENTTCRSTGDICAVDLGCDDSRDCKVGEVCCMSRKGTTGLSSRCMAVGTLSCPGVILCGGDCDCRPAQCLPAGCVGAESLRTCGGVCPT
jgi:hypothetical protein